MLPTDYKARKDVPIWTGCIMYFPDVWAEIAKVSLAGHRQHALDNGTGLFWDHSKSTDQMNTAFRHALDSATDVKIDTDGTRHMAKAIWRLCARLQMDIWCEQGDERAVRAGEITAEQAREIRIQRRVDTDAELRTQPPSIEIKDDDYINTYTGQLC